MVARKRADSLVLLDGSRRVQMMAPTSTGTARAPRVPARAVVGSANRSPMPGGTAHGAAVYPVWRSSDGIHGAYRARTTAPAATVARARRRSRARTARTRTYTPVTRVRYRAQLWV